MVEHRVAARLLDEQLDVPRVVGVAQLLDHDRALEVGVADQQALEDLAHAAGPQLVEDAVLGRLGHRRP